VKCLQRYLTIALLACVVGAIYLAIRDVDLPEVARIDRAIKEAEPIQEAAGSGAFTTTIKGYVYTLTPRASYDISGLVVSQHRGDALFNLDHAADPGNPRRLRGLGRSGHERIVSKGEVLERRVHLLL